MNDLFHLFLTTSYKPALWVLLFPDKRKEFSIRITQWEIRHRFPFESLHPPLLSPAFPSPFSLFSLFPLPLLRLIPLFPVRDQSTHFNHFASFQNRRAIFCSSWYIMIDVTALDTRRIIMVSAPFFHLGICVRVFQLTSLRDPTKHFPFLIAFQGVGNIEKF